MLAVQCVPEFMSSVIFLTAGVLRVHNTAVREMAPVPGTQVQAVHICAT